MPLVKATIQQNLETFLLSLQDQETLTDEDRQKISNYASGLSDWLISSVKTATVTVSSGIPVLAPPPSGTGSTTGPGSGTIS